MEFIKDYMDDTNYRHMLCEMTKSIFDFTFEDWYSAGYHEGEYIPYSFIENGVMISNAAANITKTIQNGEEKLYIQLGTVMTHPSYRDLGLAKKLIQRILQDYQTDVDGFYLYANVKAIGFYERLGFQRLDQWRYSAEWHGNGTKTEDCFKRAGKTLLGKYVTALRSAHINPRLDQINRTSLQLFYTGKMENVYYCEKLDCFAVIRIVEDDLYLDSVISSEYIPLNEILKFVPVPFKKVILGFTPEVEDAKDFTAEKYDGEDEYRFFYMGDSLKTVSDEKLYFPVMSHA